MSLLNQMLLVAQDGGGGGGGMVAALLGLVIPLGIIILLFAGQWKTFTKAGKPGWACIIPFYNVIVMLEIAGRPVWWIAVIILVPFVNVIFVILMYIDMAKNFGKGAGYGLGLLFLPFIFFPLLGFGDAVYQPQSQQ